MLTDKYFWFSQPSLILNTYDKVFFLVFCGLFVLSLVLWGVKAMTANPVTKKMLGHWRSFAITIGAVGMLWFVFRYENTPVFAKRTWAAVIMLAGLVWIGFLFKYMFTNYRREKSEYSANQLKSKYMPKGR